MTTAGKLAMAQSPTGHDLDVVHALHDRILALKLELSRNAMFFGAALAQMRDHEYYRALGFHSFEDYLVSPEVGLHRATAYSFMRIYQRFRPVAAEAQRLDWTKLDILTQIIKEGEAPERILPLLAQANETPRPDLRAAVKAEKQRKLDTPAAEYVIPDRLTVPGADVVHALHGDEPTSYPEWHAPEPIEASYTAAPIQHVADDALRPLTSADLLSPVAPMPTTPDPLAPSPPSPALPTAPFSDDDNTMSARQYAIKTKYNHFIGDLLRVVDRHQQLLDEVDPTELTPITTEADEMREESAMRGYQWLVRKATARRQPLRRVV